MDNQNREKDEIKRELREAAKIKINVIISGSQESLERKDIQDFWKKLMLMDGDADYSAYFDLYVGLAEYAKGDGLVSVENLVDLLNKVVYLENNNRKTAN